MFQNKTKKLEILFLIIVFLILIFILFLSELKETSIRAEIDIGTFVEDYKMDTFVVLEKDYTLKTFVISEKKPIQIEISIRTTKRYRDKFYEYHNKTMERRKETFMR